jgi:tetratricopeptide (TPR) repeat protein
MVGHVIPIMLTVVAASLGLPSQIGATAVQADVPKESVQVAQSYLDRGEALSETRNYAAAIAAYSSAIQLKPDFAEAYNDRGFAYYLNGNAERAIADFTRAIELRPNYPKAYNSRGVVDMSNGYGASKAIADFDRAIAVSPRAYLYHLRGYCRSWGSLPRQERTSAAPFPSNLVTTNSMKEWHLPSCYPAIWKKL